MSPKITIESSGTHCLIHWNHGKGGSPMKLDSYFDKNVLEYSLNQMGLQYETYGACGVIFDCPVKLQMVVVGLIKMCYPSHLPQPVLYRKALENADNYDTKKCYL